MADNDIFRMLAIEDKLDGTNYPLWAYMMHHVLVAKGLWNIVQGYDVRPIVAGTSTDDAGAAEDVAGTSLLARSVPPPTAKQIRWDGRDAQAHELIDLLVKCFFIPHIRSCKIAREAWDVLCTLYQARNEARVAYLRKQVES